MKKHIIAALIGVSLTSSAFAGTYSNAVSTYKRCENMRELAVYHYNLPQPERGEYIQVYAESVLFEEKVGVNKKNAERYLNSSAALYALRDAKSASDAGLTVWGWCMDRYAPH